MEREADFQEALVGWREWAMSRDLIPTFTGGGVTARIHWRPVGVAAWEIVDGDRGLCSLPRFRNAGEAKEAAWAWLSAEGLGR
jgi:hypothetical protein